MNPEIFLWSTSRRGNVSGRGRTTRGRGEAWRRLAGVGVEAPPASPFGDAPPRAGGRWARGSHRVHEGELWTSHIKSNGHGLCSGFRNLGPAGEWPHLGRDRDMRGDVRYRGMDAASRVP